MACMSLIVVRQIVTFPSRMEYWHKVVVLRTRMESAKRVKIPDQTIVLVKNRIGIDMDPFCSVLPKSYTKVHQKRSKLNITGVNVSSILFFLFLFLSSAAMSFLFSPKIIGD